MANVRFVRTTKERQRLRITNGECDINALYFCTDSCELYRADQLLTDGCRLVPSFDELPEFEVAADGITYYTEDNKNGYVLNQSRDGWIPVTPDYTQYATTEQIEIVTRQIESVRLDVEDQIKTEIEEQMKEVEVAGNLDGGEI